MNQEEVLRDPEYQRLLAEIDRQVDYVDIKPYSHNIISMCLLQVAEKFGREYANDIMVECNLTKYGWQPVPLEDDI